MDQAQQEEATCKLVKEYLKNYMVELFIKIKSDMQPKFENEMNSYKRQMDKLLAQKAKS